MEHASSSSLISLGLATDTSLEGSSFRWGLAASIALHALIIILTMFVRFHSVNEQPFRAISVSLISLPATLATESKPTPAPVPTKKSAVSPKPSPKPAPAPPVVEETLPPLPVGTTSERLSESFGGAINSIVVPQKREATSPTIPSQEPTPNTSEDSSPLIENLRLPSAAPTIARPKRLKPTEPVKIPSTTSPPTLIAKTTEAPPNAPSLPSSTPAESIQPVKKSAPTLPSLNEVTPFQSSVEETSPPKIEPTAKISESLERSLPKVPTPFSGSTFPQRTRERPVTEPQSKSARPQVSAPKLSRIPERPRSTAPIPAQPKMSDTVKRLMEGLKSKALPPTPKPAPLTPSKPFSPPTPSTQSPPSAIDQRIAKLSIPEVASVASIKQRLKLLEVEPSESPGSSATKPSDGKNRYLALVEDRIDRQWVAPPLLGSNPLVVLKFHISRSGKISDIQIAESSGHAHYDSAARRAVQAVNPLPAFPSDVSDSFFNVKYRFIKD